MTCEVLDGQTDDQTDDCRAHTHTLYQRISGRRPSLFLPPTIIQRSTNEREHQKRENKNDSGRQILDAGENLFDRLHSVHASHALWRIDERLHSPKNTSTTNSGRKAKKKVRVGERFGLGEKRPDDGQRPSRMRKTSALNSSASV